MTDEQKALREAVARATYNRWRAAHTAWPVFYELTGDAMANELADADAAIAVVLERAARVADEMGYECEGCGHLCGNPQTDMAIIKKAGGLSCCPERKMRPLGSAIRAFIPASGAKPSQEAE